MPSLPGVVVVAGRLYVCSVSINRLMRFLITVSLILSARLSVEAAPTNSSEIHFLVPGLVAQELPLHLSNINNLRFAPDGRLTALAYDGKVHLLSDSNGDGLQDRDDLFWDKPSLSVPVGMAWSKEGLYVSSHGKVSLLRDVEGDGRGIDAGRGGDDVA